MATEEKNTRRARHHATSRQRTAHAPKPIGGGFVSKLIIMLAVVAAVIISFVIFFKVENITVRGNSIYDTAAVIDASGLHRGDNLLTVNKPSVAGKIRAVLPYVDEVRISRRLPDTVILEVSESDAALSVKDESGAPWLMSFGGKVLEQAPGGDAPTVIGFTLKNPVVGESAKSEQQENLDAALQVLSYLSGTGLSDKISKLDVSKPYDIALWYTDQFEIRLGGTDQMEYKIQYLLAVLEQLSEYQTGTIDLTFKTEKVARFIPW